MTANSCSATASSPVKPLREQDAQLVWIAWDTQMMWLHGLIAALTGLGIVAFVVIAPLWRYRVHRWEISLTAGPPAVYTRSGWITQERRIAPISRVQTVDTYRGPLDRLFGGRITVGGTQPLGSARATWGRHLQRHHRLGFSVASISRPVRVSFPNAAGRGSRPEKRMP